MLENCLPHLRKFNRRIATFFFTLINLLFKIVFLVASASTLLNLMTFVLFPNLQTYTIETRNMMPTIDSGDVLLINKATSSFRAGDIVLVNVEVNAKRSYRTVRRLTSVEQLENGAKIMTKADYYLADDQFVYRRDRPWSTKQNIIGKVMLNLSPFTRLGLQIQDPYNVFATVILRLFGL